jgi:hypothetical protein
MGESWGAREVGEVFSWFQVEKLYRHSLISRENCFSSLCRERGKSQWPGLQLKNYHKGVSFHLHVMNIYFFLQSVLESLPGVDPQSDAVRQAVGAMSKSSTSKKDTDKKDDKDGKK